MGEGVADGGTVTGGRDGVVDGIGKGLRLGEHELENEGLAVGGELVGSSLDRVLGE